MGRKRLPYLANGKLTAYYDVFITIGAKSFRAACNLTKEDLEPYNSKFVNPEDKAKLNVMVSASTTILIACRGTFQPCILACLPKQLLGRRGA